MSSNKRRGSLTSHRFVRFNEHMNMKLHSQNRIFIYVGKFQMNQTAAILTASNKIQNT